MLEQELCPSSSDSSFSASGCLQIDSGMVAIKVMRANDMMKKAGNNLVETSRSTENG